MFTLSQNKQNLGLCFSLRKWVSCTFGCSLMFLVVIIWPLWNGGTVPQDAGEVLSRHKNK